MGQLSHKVAQYRLERGETVATLQQLMGASSVFGAISTQFSLHSVNFLGLGLLLMWLLSPVGAQSALRFLSASFLNSLSSPTLAYLDITATSNLMNASTWNSVNTAANGLFLASLVTANRTGRSSTDLWGNVKIPILGSDLERNGNSAEPTGQELVYSSMIGVPVFGMLQNGNTSATITTSYLAFNCSDLIKMEWGSAIFNKTHSTGVLSSHLVYLNGTKREASIRWTNPIYDLDFTTGNYSVATCSVVSVPVNASIHCARSGAIGSQGDCIVTAIRAREEVNQTEDLPDVFSSADQFSSLIQGLENSMPSHHAATPVIMDEFMNNPFGSYGNFDTNISLYKLSPDIFSQRLTQLVNSFYIARSGYQFLTMSSLPGWRANDTDEVVITYQASSAKFNIVEATGVQKDTILTCSLQWTWFAFFLLATLLLIASCITTCVITSRTLSPDVLGYVSSMTSQVPQIDTSVIPSTLSGWERARLLKDVSIRFGDVDAQNPKAGTLGIGLTPSTVRSRSDRDYR